MHLITLTTDFGLGDSYVAQMKGVALALCPELRFVDLCHEVPPQDVEAGAFILETGYSAFPPETIHVAVVDPGVGTARGAVAVRTERYWFLAPDNGLLSRVLRCEPVRSARRLEPGRCAPPPRSATFDGRELFAPAAAWIARGRPAEELGPVAGELVELPAAPRLAPGQPAQVRVLHVDRFGNAVLDLSLERLHEWLGAELADAGLHVVTPQGRVIGLRRTYADGRGGPLLLVNSAGYLELAVDRGRAAEELGLQRGTVVELLPGAAQEA